VIDSSAMIFLSPKSPIFRLVGHTRLIVAKARVESLPLVTGDPEIQQSGLVRTGIKPS
jgi:PIN domain nuclease of toxin-antitoxin system